MRNPVVVITGSSSSSIFASHHHHCHVFNPKLPLPALKLQQQSLSPRSSPSSLASALSKPLVSSTFNPSGDGDGFSQSSLGYYAEVGSALVEEGRFEEFGDFVDDLVDTGEAEAIEFGRLLNLELLASGIAKGFKEGRVKGAIQLLCSIF